MQLSPLQSRLAASVIATLLLIILYLSLFNPQFAFAEEINHASPIVLDDGTNLDTPERELELEMRDLVYEPDFQAFDRSIIGRAVYETTTLENNVPAADNLNAGESMPFVFDPSQLLNRQDPQLELRGEPGTAEETPEGEARDGDARPRKRATGTVYISANTCLQPSGNTSASSSPPQLALYVSTSTENKSPGPSGDSSQQDVLTFTEGAVMYNLTTSDIVYFAVAAGNVSSDFSGVYNFQVAASVDGWYHDYKEAATEELFWVDSDTTSVLLMTNNLTTSYDSDVEQSIMSSTPYVMFAQDDADQSITGLRHSYCGLNNNAQIAAVRNGQATTQVTTGMTKRGAGGHPKQQFYFSGLNSSTKYQGILARNVNNSTDTNVVGGGGTVFRATEFETKSSFGNCALVFNLTFCDEVAYAVPSNNQTFPNSTALGDFYDNYALSLYDGFNKSMQLIQCEADDTAQYSLVRNCSTCHAAYKDWLCSVTIPRCEDFSNTARYLQPRAINTTFPDGKGLDPALLDQYSSFSDQLSYKTSRNPMIDSDVKPGPYKEVLPCEELCYDLVQSCPAAMGFSCPRPWNQGFNTSYGTKSGSGNITCNYPGSFHYFSGAAGSSVSWLLTAAMVSLATAASWW